MPSPALAAPEVQHVGLSVRWVLALMFEGRDNDHVRAALDADLMPCPPDAELDALRGQFVPRRFKPKSKKGAELLERLGLGDWCFSNTSHQDPALTGWVG